MSHEVETMFYTDWETPWHGLGTPIHEAPAGADALKLAGLDWTVGLVPLYTNGPIDQAQGAGTPHAPRAHSLTTGGASGPFACPGAGLGGR